MRQVPETKSQHAPTYALLGGGRLASHLSFYFQELAIPVRKWSRSPRPEWNHISVTSEPDPIARLELTVDGADIVLIAVTDDAIESVIHKLPPRAGRPIVHFSGALATDLAESAHPLMTFSHRLYERETYERIPFVLEAGRRPFLEIFPTLPNPHFTIPTELKTLYHALCVTGGNFTQFLWQEVLSLAPRRLGLPAEAFFPYLLQVARNLAADPQTAATGPLVRGDNGTIQKHLAALQGTPLLDIYESFLKLKRVSALKEST